MPSLGSRHGVLAMTVQEKLESLAFSETERALIRKWLNETPSRPRSRLRLHGRALEMRKFLNFDSRETIRTWLAVITVLLQIAILIQVVGG